MLRRRRSLNGKTWDDDEHIDMVQAADDLQDDLRDEKKRLDALTKGARSDCIVDSPAERQNTPTYRPTGSCTRR